MHVFLCEHVQYSILHCEHVEYSIQHVFVYSTVAYAVFAVHEYTVHY
jgi:hypothetical protein